MDAEFAVGLFRDADDVVDDVLTEAGHRALPLSSGAGRVDLVPDRHFRFVDDDLLPLLPRVRRSQVLGLAYPEAGCRSSVAAAGRSLPQEARKGAITTGITR